MKINEANIDISRKEGKLISVSVAMPIWDKVGMDDFISVNIPLFNTKTFAKDEKDADVAIAEAIKGFCISAEKFGRGLEAELKLLGWNFIEQSDDFTSMAFIVSDSNTVIDQIMQTGEQFAEKLDLAC